jgi:protein-L-isoaspartate(D-aspartate) O-methyltransferase
VRLEDVHSYQPQQSVLNPHAEQRQTACMRYISAPHRSQSTLSAPAGAPTFGGVTGPGGGWGGVESDIRELSHMPEFAEARARMVAEQLERRGIADRRVLDAMRSVPRHEFVASADRLRAYADQALPIGEGQTISQPYMVAAMTEALALTGVERVLEIGTGSGYQAAVLAELARDVISIERHAALAEEARGRLAALGYSRVEVLVGDGSTGYLPRAPYDAILVAAGAPRVPGALTAQLADGGRLAIPVGPYGQQELRVVRRDGARLVETAREACVFVPLVGAEGWPA